MNICTDILLISTLACRIAECLDDNELALLAADTVLLSDALNAIAVRRAILKEACESQNDNSDTDNKENTEKQTSKNNQNTAKNNENSSISQNSNNSNKSTAINNGNRSINQSSNK